MCIPSEIWDQRKTLWNLWNMWQADKSHTALRFDYVTTLNILHKEMASICVTCLAIYGTDPHPHH